MKFNSGLFARGRGGKSTFNFMQRATAWIFDFFFLSRKTIHFPSVLCKRFFFFCLQPKSEINKLEDNQSAFLWGLGALVLVVNGRKLNLIETFKAERGADLKRMPHYHKYATIFFLSLIIICDAIEHWQPIWSLIKWLGHLDERSGSDLWPPQQPISTSVQGWGREGLSIVRCRFNGVRERETATCAEM